MYPSVAKANQALSEAQARSQGHEVQVVCTWMIEDDADFHAECKCGWRSQDMRDSYSCARFGRVHMAEVARG